MANNLVAKFRDRSRCPFSRKGLRLDQNNRSLESLTSYSSWKPPDFSKDQIRLVVYRESDNKGRKPLFDSKAVEKLETKSECKKFTAQKGKSGKITAQNESPCTTYQMLRPSSDSKMLGEMVFGSVAMSYMGSTTKVHVIRTPVQLMLTKVYVTSSPRTSSTLSQDSGTENGENNSSLCSCPKNIDSYNSPKGTESAASSIAHSMPMDMPDSPLLAMKRVSSTGDTADSGISRSASTESFSYLGSSASSISSGGGVSSHSLIRRWRRFQVGSSHHRRRSEDLNNSSVTDETLARQRCPKLGVSIIFNLFDEKYEEKNREFKKFFFSHFALLESHFHQLCQDVEQAYQTGNNKNFVTALMQSLEELRSAVHLLYTAPRIREPVWLNMMTFCNQRGRLLDRFLRELLTASQQYNLKATNNFLSRLLTAVLTHHLAWVPTVTPADAMPIKKYLEFKSSSAHHKILSLAKYHPYNPLWAQLGDLYGAVGYPMKQARTVVVGQRQEVVCRLLYILTYFIRCSEVFENIEKLVPFNFFELDKSGGVSEEDVNVNGTSYTLVSHLSADSPDCRRTPTPGGGDGKQQAPPSPGTPGQATADGRADPSALAAAAASNGPVWTPEHPGGITESPAVRDGCVESPDGGHSQEGAKEVEAGRLCKEAACANLDSKKVDVVAVGRSVSTVEYSEVKAVGGGGLPAAASNKERLSGSAALIPPSYLRLSSMEGSSSIFDEYFEDDANNNPDTTTTTSASSASGPKSPEEVNGRQGAAGGRPSTLSLHPPSPSAGSSSGRGEQMPVYQRTSSELSSASTMSTEEQLELPMPKSESSMDSIENQDKHTGNFGRSLLGGYSQDYLPDFALHGTKQAHRETIMKELTRSVQHSVLDETVEDVVCIVADTDKWEVEVMSAKSAVCEKVHTSNLAHNLLLSIQKLWQLKMSTEFCMIHLEDKLQEMYFKSKTLTEYVRSSRSHLTAEKLSRELDVDSSDIQLLTAISTVYSLPEYCYADTIDMTAPT